MYHRRPLQTVLFAFVDTQDTMIKLLLNLDWLFIQQASIVCKLKGFVFSCADGCSVDERVLI